MPQQKLAYTVHSCPGATSVLYVTNGVTLLSCVNRNTLSRLASNLLTKHSGVSGLFVITLHVLLLVCFFLMVRTSPVKDEAECVRIEVHTIILHYYTRLNREADSEGRVLSCMSHACLDLNLAFDV